MNPTSSPLLTVLVCTHNRAELLAQTLKSLDGATRPADTPVAIARNLGRPGETLTIATLADAADADIDMLTIVVIGSSQTRLALAGGTQRLYTPRGYAAGRTQR